MKPVREVTPELRRVLKRLCLGQIIDTLPERVALAQQQKMSFEDILLMVLGDEIARRDSTAATRRAQRGGLERDMVIERWDTTANVHYDRGVFNELCSLRFVEQRRNVVVLGPVGVGKTFLASALGHLACRSGFNVRFVRADAMLRQLRQSRMDNSRDALMTELCTLDLLIVDDFALEPMSRDESRDVYQLFVERNARASTIVTSNRDTSEWLAVFDDALLAQSAIDRFRNNAYDLVMEGESYRARLKPKVDPSTPQPQARVVKKASGRRRNLID